MLLIFFCCVANSTQMHSISWPRRDLTSTKRSRNERGEKCNIQRRHVSVPNRSHERLDAAVYGVVEITAAKGCDRSCVMRYVYVVVHYNPFNKFAKHKVQCAFPMRPVWKFNSRYSTLEKLPNMLDVHSSRRLRNRLLLFALCFSDCCCNKSHFGAVGYFQAPEKTFI